MQSETERLTEMLGRLRQMAPGDRKAVLARMPLDQRYSVEQLLQRKRSPDNGEHTPPSPARKYAIFSPVLARMLAAIEEGAEPQGGDHKALAKATSQALADAAAEICEATKNSNKTASLWDSVNKLIFGEKAQ